jgi:hypothetical protein
VNERVGREEEGWFVLSSGWFGAKGMSRVQEKLFEISCDPSRCRVRVEDFVSVSPGCSGSVKLRVTG